MRVRPRNGVDRTTVSSVCKLDPPCGDSIKDPIDKRKMTNRVSRVEREREREKRGLDLLRTTRDGISRRWSEQTTSNETELNTSTYNISRPSQPPLSGDPLQYTR